MKKRAAFGVAVVLVVVLVVFWFLRKSDSTARSKAASAREEKAPVQSSKPPETKPEATTPPPPNLGGYPPWHGGRAMSLDDPRWKIVHERDKADQKWEWKMPIDFYGKVVDEKSQPISGAIVKFSWNDTSNEGSSNRETKTGVNGLFELHDVKGKILDVHVEKDGYEVVRSKNRYYFEYAGFWENEFYEADPQNPVIFYLHKKGETEPLVYSQKEFDASVGKPVTVKIADQTQLQFTLASNENPPRGTWEAKVSISNGGMTPALEEFNTEAPATGYQATMALSRETPKPPKWELYQGGSFYFQAGQNYGRMTIEMIPGHDWVRFKWWLNPKPGSRNVEYDPAKEITPGK